jgi:hypothetical protein
MFTSPALSLTSWKYVLLTIGLKEPHITDDLIAILAAYEFKQNEIREDSFRGYYQGSTESEAGILIAQECAVLNPLQEFLRPIIDWEQAWERLKTMERYILIKTNEKGVWALFALG